jgi:hypothetical protein
MTSEAIDMGDAAFGTFSDVAGLTDEVRSQGVKRTHSRHRGSDANGPTETLQFPRLAHKADDTRSTPRRPAIQFAMFKVPTVTQLKIVKLISHSFGAKDFAPKVNLSKINQLS